MYAQFRSFATVRAAIVAALQGLTGDDSMRNFTAAFTWALLAALMWPAMAGAQVKCKNAQSVGCDYHPIYGWIERGSAPPAESVDSASPAPAPVDQAALDESMRRYREEQAKKQEDAERAAREAELNYTLSLHDALPI